MIKYIVSFPNILVKKATANMTKKYKLKNSFPLFYSSPITHPFNNVLKLY